MTILAVAIVLTALVWVVFSRPRLFFNESIKRKRDRKNPLKNLLKELGEFENLADGESDKVAAFVEEFGDLTTKLAEVDLVIYLVLSKKGRR